MRCGKVVTLSPQSSSERWNGKPGNGEDRRLRSACREARRFPRPVRCSHQVALVCVLIEAVGQALVWLAPWSTMAYFGAAVTGFGYSLVYPGFGVEAVRNAPPESRGLAMGAYTAFLDLALGFANPALGLVASGAGLSGVYLVSTLVVLCAAIIAVRLLNAPSFRMKTRS